MKKHDQAYIAGIGDKVRNRHSSETGVVSALCTNEAGSWYYINTQSGMAIGWWHETDLDAMPKSVAPSTKRTASKDKAA